MGLVTVSEFGVYNFEEILMNLSTSECDGILSP
jgi:hypothetical protein